MDFSPAQVQQLSPDEASLKAAKGLVIPGKWKNLGKNARAIWGECQGSGSKPYQVEVDLNGPAFKCTCPSRKFPCKHGLAILLLLQDAALFTGSEEPAWVSEWIDSRQDKAEKQAAKKEATAAKPVDPEAQAKREQQREARMLSGLQELSSWMQDQIRQGLQLLPSRIEQMEHLASRMVDSQLTGIASRIRQWPVWMQESDQWPETILADWGLLQLLVDAFPNLSRLDDALRQDVLSTLGVNPDKQELQEKSETLEGEWIVMGQVIQEDNRLWMRRAWLQNPQGRMVYLLDFSHGMRKFEPALINGSRIHAKLLLQQGRGLQRAFFVDAPEILSNQLPPAFTLDESLNQLTDVMSVNPWRRPIAISFSDMCLRRSADNWLIVNEQQQIPLTIDNSLAWSLFSESAGGAVNFFGEWQDQVFRPLSIWKDHWIWHQGDMT